MQIIIKGGLHTKNSPKNTKDSVLLALESSRVDGVLLNVQMTKDNKLVVAIDNRLYHCSISENNYIDLMKYNLGSKVKKHTVILLEEVLKLYQNSSQKLILEISLCNNPKELVEQLAFLLNQYQPVNSYITTPLKEIVIYAQNSLKNSKVGASILNQNSDLWNLDLDFYIVNPNSLNTREIAKNVKDQKIIMLELMSRRQVNEILLLNHNLFENQLFWIINEFTEQQEN
ncbi:MAG: hypothetical protein PUB18_04465 [bacterium]|nr:hypothetical protein [bacterium]